MKRVTCIVLALLLVVMLAGCGATGTTGSGGKRKRFGLTAHLPLRSVSVRRRNELLRCVR